MNLAANLARLVAFVAISTSLWAGTPASAGDPTLHPEMPESAPLYTGCGGVYVPPIHDAFEQEVVELVNEARAMEGIPPMKRIIELDAAARYHSADMAQDNYFNHDTYDQGIPDPVCAWNVRIGGYYAGGDPISENIAAGYEDPQAVFAGWMDSSGHRANILDPNMWEIGSGYSPGTETSTFAHYWTLDFGKRLNVFPLVINREAAVTESRTVSVYLYGKEQNQWLEMRLKDGDGVWGDWQPFQTEFEYTFTAGNGDRTLHAEMRAGVVAGSAKDSIILNEPEPALGNLPDALSFTYIITSETFLPASASIQPHNTGGGGPIAWSLAQVGSWFTALPASGVTSDTITVAPVSPGPDTPGVYTGTLTITTDPAAAGSPHTIDLTLLVLAEPPLYKAYLPVVIP